MKNKIMTLVASHRSTVGEMVAKLNRVDSRWKESEQVKAKAEIRAEYQQRIDDLVKQIDAARKELAAHRQAEADPMRSLFRKAYERDVTPSLQILLDALDVFDSNTISALVDEYKNPLLTLKAWQIFKSRDLQGDEGAAVQQRLFKAANEFIDVKAIKETAELEKALIDTEIFHLNNVKPERSPSRILNLGYESAALDRIISGDPRKTIPKQFDRTAAE